MQKIEYSQNDFNGYVALLHTLDFKAVNKTPSKKDLLEIILPDITEFFTLLMWINNTGTKTKENAECRNLIRKALNSSIQLTDNNEKSKISPNTKHAKENINELAKKISTLDFKAGDITPSKEELNNVIFPNLFNFISLLLWILETGYDTEKNKECRALIRTKLLENTNLKSKDNYKNKINNKLISTEQTPAEDVRIQPALNQQTFTEIKIKCTYEDYDKYTELFHSLNYQAADYTPEKTELINVILPNLPKYILMLIWIEETGYETEENSESRKLIHKILTSSLELIDDATEQE